jgi:hypothetical protein
MSYKNRLFLELMKEAGEDLTNVARASGKFIKDAVLTEVVPRELKSNLRNYSPPDFYLKAIRPSLKFWATFLGGTASVFLGKNTNLGTAAFRAQPIYIYGFADFGYDLADFKQSEYYLPPATLLVEGGYKAYSYVSDLCKRAKLKTNI